MPPPAGNITFVSMLVQNTEDPAPPASPLKRIEWLLPLVRAGLQLVLYVDSFYAPLFSGEEQPNLRVVPFDLASTEIATHVRAFSFAQLPTFRNQAKDTRFFMTLMNAKTELVARAVRDGLITTPFVGFLDASVAKVLREPTRTMGALRTATVSAERLEGRVLIPGCTVPGIPAGGTPMEELARGICWKFCGGFFLLPVGLAMEWHVACREKLLEFLRRKWLTWEVNVWVALVEGEWGSRVRWFLADHNDTMLRIPADLLEERWQEPAPTSDKIESAGLYGC